MLRAVCKWTAVGILGAAILVTAIHLLVITWPYGAFGTAILAVAAYITYVMRHFLHYFDRKQEHLEHDIFWLKAAHRQHQTRLSEQGERIGKLEGR